MGTELAKSYWKRPAGSAPTVLARRLRRAVQALTELLGDHPYLGTQRPELARAPYRFAVVRGFPYIA